MGGYQFESSLERLKRSDLYRRLLSLQPTFNLFAVLGIQHREIPHSYLLAWMLEEQELVAFRRQLLGGLAERARNRELQPLAHLLNKCGLGTKPIVYRELGRIDVLADFSDARLSLAIENKIWAGEQERQIERYQDFMASRCGQHGLEPLILFLTPDGRDPETASCSHPVPVFRMGWDEVAGFLSNESEECDRGIAAFKEHILVHIREDIMGNTEARQLVRELLRSQEHRRTIRTIIDNLPTLADVKDDWIQDIRNRLGEDTGISVKHHSPGGELKEIKIYIDQWCAQNLRICFMLHNYDDRAFVNTWVLSSDMNDASVEKALVSLAKSAPDIVDADFPKLEGWYWRAVFLNEQESAQDPMSILDEDFRKKALARFSEQFARISPAVNQWLAQNGLA